MSYRPFGVVVAFISLVACGGHSSPTAPTPDPPAPTAATAAAVFVTPAALSLPVGGGSAHVTIYTSLAADGRGAATFVPVHLEASAGSLSTQDVTTDKTGHAKVEWSGDHTATITAVAQDVTGRNTITVQTPAPPIPTPSPGPTPTPSPSPNPTPLPTPTPVPPTIAVTVTAAPAAVTIGQAVTLTAVATTNAQSGGVRYFAWDVGDGTPETITPAPTFSATYTTVGAKTVRVRAVAVSWTPAEATTTVTVTAVPPVAPTVTVSLSATPTTGQQGVTSIAFTATATPNSTAGAVISYQWDFDGDGIFDATTTVNTISRTYPTQGVWSTKVKATTANGATATATTTVVITI